MAKKAQEAETGDSLEAWTVFSAALETIGRGISWRLSTFSPMLAASFAQ